MYQTQLNWSSAAIFVAGKERNDREINNYIKQFISKDLLVLCKISVQTCFRVIIP